MVWLLLLLFKLIWMEILTQIINFISFTRDDCHCWLGLIGCSPQNPPWWLILDFCLLLLLLLDTLNNWLVCWLYLLSWLLLTNDLLLLRAIGVLWVVAVLAVLSSPETVSEINLFLPLLLYNFTMLTALVWIWASRLTSIIWVLATTRFLFFGNFTASEPSPSMNVLLGYVDWIHYHIFWVVNNCTLSLLSKDVWGDINSFDWFCWLDFLVLAIVPRRITSLILDAKAIILLYGDHRLLVISKSNSFVLAWSRRQSLTCLFHIWRATLGTTDSSIYTIVINIKFGVGALLARHCIL